MKASLELRKSHTHGYTQRLGKVHFTLEGFAEPGSSLIKVWMVNHQHEFKRLKDANTFMQREADRIGGGDTTSDENYKWANNNHIHAAE